MSNHLIVSENINYDFRKTYLGLLAHLNAIFKDKRSDWLNLHLFQSLYQRSDLDLYRSLLENYSFDDVVVLGTGGSSLGGQLLVKSFSEKKDYFHFLDSIDPIDIHSVLEKVNLSKTLCIVVSKSGETAETLMQFLYFIEKYEFHVQTENLKNHFIVITENKNNSFREIANLFDMPIIDHPEDISGRFSIFTASAILPAMLAGIDVDDFRSGAVHYLDRYLTMSEEDAIDPVKGAAFNLAAYQHNLSNVVLFNYASQINPILGWWSQLTAESLGKGRYGVTPLEAKGPQAQHSHLQLYLDGPKDKSFIFLSSKGKASENISVPSELQGNENIMSFHLKPLDTLLDIERKATLEVFKNHSIPYREIQLKEVSPQHLGGLVLQFMLETMLVAEYFQINPFDQPAVEEGKRIALRMLKNNDQNS